VLLDRPGSWDTAIGYKVYDDLEEENEKDRMKLIMGPRGRNCF
jgi:hypothetical protein